MRAPKPLLMTAPATGTTGTPGTTPAAGTTPADPMAEFRKLLLESTTAAAGGTALSDRETKLLRENYKARDKVRELTGQLEAVTKKAAPDGATVLTGDEAKEYAEFKKLGIPMKDLTVKLTEHGTLAKDKTERDAAAALDDVAEALGITNVRAFKRLVVAEGLTVTMKTMKVKDEETGKMVDEQVPVVLTRGAKEGTEPEPLLELLERDFAEDVPTLVAESGTDAIETGSTTEPVRQARTLGGITASRNGSHPTQDDAATGGTRFPRLGSAAPTGAGSERKRNQDALAAKQARGGYSL